MPLVRNKLISRTFYVFLGILLVTSLLIFIITPLAFRWFPGIMKSFIFSLDKEIPENLDYKHPENFGFVGGRNFYLTTSDGASLGVWHILPSKLEDEARNLNVNETDKAETTHIYNNWLSNATVVMYLHGSAGTRTSPHRLRLYRLLNSLNCHVIAFDYRGYGDSTSFPRGETDLIEDTNTVYTWIIERVKTGNIFLWGHSLGTGVAAHASQTLASKGEQIKGIVLEAPFSNMADIVGVSSLTSVVSFLPWFHYCFIEPLYKNDMSFDATAHLEKSTQPLLILHAKDDKVIPYKFAAKLYHSVLASRKNSTTVKMISYDSSLHYGHYKITLDPHLGITIRKFIEEYAS